MGSLRHGSTILTLPTKKKGVAHSSSLCHFHRDLRYAIQQCQVERVRKGNISTKFSPREPALMLYAHHGDGFKEQSLYSVFIERLAAC